jgi:hypothetical protein
MAVRTPQKAYGPHDVNFNTQFILSSMQQCASKSASKFTGLFSPRILFISLAILMLAAPLKYWGRLSVISRHFPPSVPFTTF